MKTIVSKPGNLFIIIMLFLFSLTACNVLESTTSAMITPEEFNPTAFIPAEEEVDVAHTVPTTSIVNTGISNLQSVSDLETSLI